LFTVSLVGYDIRPDHVWVDLSKSSILWIVSCLLHLCFAICCSVLHLCGRRNRLCYGFCPSVCLSVGPSVPYGLLTWKRKSVEKPKLVWTFPMTGVTGMPIFSLES